MNSEREAKEPIVFCHNEMQVFESTNISLDSNFQDSHAFMTPQGKNIECVLLLSSTASTIDKSSTSKS